MYKMIFENNYEVLTSFVLTLLELCVVLTAYYHYFSFLFSERVFDLPFLFLSTQIHIVCCLSANEHEFIFLSLWGPHNLHLIDVFIQNEVQKSFCWFLAPLAEKKNISFCQNTETVSCIPLSLVSYTRSPSPKRLLWRRRARQWKEKSIIWKRCSLGSTAQ